MQRLKLLCRNIEMNTQLTEIKFGIILLHLRFRIKERRLKCLNFVRRKLVNLLQTDMERNQMDKNKQFNGLLLKIPRLNCVPKY